MFDLYGFFCFALASLLFLFAIKKVIDFRSFRYLINDALGTPGHGLVIFDKKGRVRVINKQAEKFIPGLKGKSFSSSGLNEFINFLYDHAVDCDPALKNALQKSAQRAPFEGFREVFPWGDGKENLCMGEMVKTAKGAYVLILIDLNHHKKYEDEVLGLSARNKELAHAIEQSTTGIIILNPNISGHPVVFANQMFCDHIEVSGNDVLGVEVGQVLSQSAFGEEVKGDILQAFDKKEAADVVIHLDEGNGGQWFTLRIRPSEEEDGSISFLIGILTDVTELKRREIELAQSQKLEALGQLAAGVAHDFNNILSIMQGYARMGKKITSDDDPIYGYFQKIGDASVRGASLTKQMLTFSRHKIVEDRVTNIGKALIEQNHFFGALLTSMVQLDVKVESDDLCVDFSTDDFTQILMNLVINARDAMSDHGGEVKIRVFAIKKNDYPPEIAEKIDADECVCLVVKDKGTGIEKEVLDKIFDPFFTTKEAGKGTGLGLSMVYGLVNQIGGHIMVNTRMGVGTTFSIYMPRSDKVVLQEIQGSLDDLGSVSFEGYTALVVDDEEELLAIMTDILEDLGINVIQANNGAEALLKQEDYTGPIDLLLTDVVMPELDGVKLAELFASLRPETPIILMSGYPQSGKMAPVDIPPDCLFITKPVQFKELVEMIFSILNKSHPEHTQTLTSSRWDIDSTDSQGDVL